MGTVPKQFQVLLDLDGRPCCRCASADVSASFVDGLTNPQPARSGFSPRRLDYIENEPITLEFHSGMGKEIAQWIGYTLNKTNTRKNGAVTFLDAKNNHTSIEFFDALITEVGIPAADMTSKGGGQLKLKIHPERIKRTQNPFDPKNLVKYGPSVSAPWSTGQFSLVIPGIERDSAAITSISSLVIKQGIKKFYAGDERFPQVEPTKIDESNILITLPMSAAEGFIGWANKLTSESMPHARDAGPKAGSLQYLAPGSKRPLLELGLFGLTPVSVNLSKDSPGSQFVRVELAVDRITVTGS